MRKMPCGSIVTTFSKGRLELYATSQSTLYHSILADRERKIESDSNARSKGL